MKYFLQLNILLLATILLPTLAHATIGTLSGAGTTASPYLIEDYTVLKAVTTYGLDKVYRLMTDIEASVSKTKNLSGTVYQGFEPIGNESTKYTGAFHGHGHVIKNLYINRPSTNRVGLFGYSSATIDSLGMVNGNITGSSEVGGLVGQNEGLISTCYWDTQNSGKSSGIGSESSSATGLTTAQMKNSGNLGDLGSFSTVWEIRQDSTYAPFAFYDTRS